MSPFICTLAQATRNNVRMGEEMEWGLWCSGIKIVFKPHMRPHIVNMRQRGLHKYMWSYQKHQSAASSFQQHFKYFGSVRHNMSCRHDFSVSYSQLEQVSVSRLSNISTIQYITQVVFKNESPLHDVYHGMLLVGIGNTKKKKTKPKAEPQNASHALSPEQHQRNDLLYQMNAFETPQSHH